MPCSIEIRVNKEKELYRISNSLINNDKYTEEEIENFKPEEYWNIYAKLKDPKSKKSFQAKFYGKDNKKIA